MFGWKALRAIGPSRRRRTLRSRRGTSRALRRRVWILPLVALCSVAVTALAGSGLWNPLDAVFRIDELRFSVSGPGVLDVDSLHPQLAAAIGASFLELDRAALVADLRARPRVQSARLSYRWPHRLLVTVCERVAVALVIDTGGRVFELSADGVLLPPRGSVAADLPLLTWEGQSLPGELAVGGLLDLRGGPDLADLLLRLPQVCPSLWQGISEAHLRADGSCELFWNDVPVVVWTRGRLSDLRLRAWAAVMSDLQQRGEEDAVIDLRYREQIVVRLPEGADAADPRRG